MIYGITYSDSVMSLSRVKCISSMLKYGINKVFDCGTEKPSVGGVYNGFSMSSEFISNNSNVIHKERGCGYWLWKPYIINEAMMFCNDGDILIYSDSGVEFINHVQHIISRMDEDIFFFTNGFPHVEWCKFDCIKSINSMEVIGGANGIQAYADRKQVQASVIFFKVNQATRNFVKEWLLYCQMPGFIDDSPSKLPNYPTFAEHRHDQAILTCLQIKYGYKLHWWPTAYAEHIRIQGDDYPVMFNHHRKRDNEW